MGVLIPENGKMRLRLYALPRGVQTFVKESRSIIKLAMTPKTSPQNGAPILKIGKPASVTRNAISPPSGNVGPKDV
jgi:hypothetical protein